MGQLSTVGKSWVSLDLSKLANVPGASSLLNNPSSDPGEMLEYLRAASDSVVAEGHQVVGGVETTKYQATVDLGRVVDSLPRSSSPRRRQAVSAMEQEGAPTTFPVAVWVDANKLVRRFEMALDMTASGQSVQMVIDTDLFDYGPQSPPSPPPSSDVAPLSLPVLKKNPYRQCRMSAPRHLWSGDWEQDSAAHAEALARRNAQRAAEPPEEEAPPEARTAGAADLWRALASR